MKNKYFGILFLLAIALASCNKEKKVPTVTCIKLSEYAYLDNYQLGSMCTDNLCTTYQSIWKELFMANNNLTDSYFNDHIELCNSDITDWQDGTSFTICYKIKLGWAIAYNCDQFIIKIKKDNNYYPALSLPRDSYLTKENIRTATMNRAFSSQILKLSNTETLKYNSMDEALNHLIKKAGVNTLCSRMIYINKSNGNLTLEAWAQYDNEFNKCIQGKIDLMTGETFIVDTPCMIN